MPPLMTAMQHIAATLAPPPEPPPVAPVLPSSETDQTAGPGTMKILVIDDHPLVLQALKGVLNQLDAEVDIFDSSSADGARELARAHADADLMLLDLGLPGADGFTLLEEFRNEYPAVPVVVLSGSESRENVTRALGLGAMGYIPKRYSNDVLIGALRLVLSGGLYVPPAVLPLAGGPAAAEKPATPPSAATIRPEDLGLTPRQSEVLALVLQGLPNKLICRRLNLAEPTVKVHMQAVLRALDAQNRVQAVIEASRRGLTIDALMARAKRKPDAATD
ncbi:MAG: response regulator transcription factor [Burkholderiales bacterium]